MSKKKSPIVPESFNAKIFGVRKAAAITTSHYAIGGVKLIADANRIHAVATDGHVLVDVSVDNAHSMPPCDALVSTEMLKVIGRRNGPITLSLVDGKIVVSSGEVEVRCSPQQGNFPKWDDPTILWSAKDAAVEIKFSPAMMKILCESVLSAAPGVTCLHLYAQTAKDTKKPVLMLGEDDDGTKVRAALMPMD